MRGVIDVEFIISVLVFLVTISFTAITIGRQFPTLEENALADSIKSRGYQISELLLFGMGEPKDWENRTLGEIKRFGLSSGQKYILDKNKIDRLEALCGASYENVRGKLGISEDIALYASVTGENEIVLNCRSAQESASGPKFVARRFASYPSGGIKRLIGMNVTLIA